MNTKNSFETPAIESNNIKILSAKLLAVTAELSAANEKLHKIQKEREEMLSNISHDLRAPITAIRSSLDYLQSLESPSVEEYHQAVSLINRRTETLENLIRDMYYLFCIEDTSRDLHLEELDAIPFLEEYFYDILADSRFDTHDMQLDLPDGFSCRINVDIQKLVRVLDNLFTNAVKYTPPDSRIILRAQEASPGSGILITVSDNGPGIPPEALPQIFHRTYTVSTARTPGSDTGSGLGLAIVKAIVERHNGTIDCVNLPTGGCCFRILLPSAPKSTTP